MRVRQVQTLVWLGNVLVLAGAGWVAWGFVQTKKSQAKVEKTEWPDSGGAAFERPLWPGDVGGFTHIWSTEVNGLVPKKEEVVVKAPERPLDEQFREKLQIAGGMLGSSATTVITFVFDGKPVALRFGESIDALGRAWQFTGFTIDTPPDKKERTATARFAAGDLKVAVTQSPQFLKGLTDEEVKKFKATYEPGGSVDPGVVSRDKIKCAAYQTAEGQWVVTQDEVLWWESFGEDEVLSKVTAKPEADPSGASRGVRLVKVPAPTAFLGQGRGLRDGDVIRSINGVAMASLKDVTDYLRGDGKCKPRYVVVYERDGAERTVTYDVERREAKRAVSRERSP